MTFIVAALVCRDWVRIPTRYVLLTRCDGLAWGAMLALLASNREFAQRRGTHATAFGLTIAMALGLMIAFRMTIFRSIFDDNSILILANPALFGAVGLVVCYAGSKLLAPLRMPWLCYVGQFSYGVYVYHYIIYKLVDYAQGVEHPDAKTLPLKIVLTFAVATLSWECLEKPVLEWKKYFPYKKLVRQSTIAAPPTQVALSGCAEAEVGACSALGDA
jgi:peptidoglycan/LPS O-acetylase OafA/YrhL